MIGTYSVALVQSVIRVASTPEDVEKNLRRTEYLVDVAVAVGRAEFPVRLVVAPETFLTSVHVSETCPAPGDIQWYIDNLAIDIPGPVTERVGAKCKEHGIYFCGTAYAREPHWPDRLFNTGFIIGPSGNVVLTYPKINTSNHLLAIACSPHDMYDEWTKVYGARLEDFFPVVDTDIGKLGVSICYDRVFPEVGRAYGVQGCEVLCNPTVWVGTYGVDDWQVHTRAMAMYNSMYVAAPNSGGSDDPAGAHPGGMVFGQSMIVDYRGRVLASTPGPGETVTLATVNIPDLRRHRLENHWFNQIPQIRSDLYAKIYEKPLWARNRYLSRPPRSVSELRQAHDEIVRDLSEQGVFLPADHVGPVL